MLMRINARIRRDIFETLNTNAQHVCADILLGPGSTRVRGYSHWVQNFFRTNALARGVYWVQILAKMKEPTPNMRVGCVFRVRT